MNPYSHLVRFAISPHFVTGFYVRKMTPLALTVLENERRRLKKVWYAARAKRKKVAA